METSFCQYRISTSRPLALSFQGPYLGIILYMIHLILISVTRWLDYLKNIWPSATTYATLPLCIASHFATNLIKFLPNSK